MCVCANEEMNDQMCLILNRSYHTTVTTRREYKIKVILKKQKNGYVEKLSNN